MTAETVILNRVGEDAELDAAVGALAETIAAQPPLALRHAKRAIDAFADQERSLQLAAEGQAACLRSEDFIDAGQGCRRGRGPGVPWGWRPGSSGVLDRADRGTAVAPELDCT